MQPELFVLFSRHLRGGRIFAGYSPIHKYIL